MNLRKQQIALNFSRAVDHYDANAPVQREAGEQLMQIIRSLPPPRQALEIGCGTGFLTDLLLKEHPNCDWLITDIAEDMLHHCRRKLENRARFAKMDGEHPTTEQQFDLICANLSFQWFGNLQSALNKLYGCLTPGGYIVFSTLGKQSFHEWRNIHHKYDLQAGTTIYPTRTELTRMLPQRASHQIDEVQIRQHYNSALDFLRSLKAIGAGLASRNYKPLSAGDLRTVMRDFDQLEQPSATYHLLYTWIKRP